MNTALRLTSTVLRGLAVVLGVLVVNFFLVRLAPGDPALMLAGDAGSGDAAYVERLRVQLGLSRPLVEQFALYLRDLAHVDFGFSYRNQMPVLQLVVDRLPATLLLMAAAFAVSVVAGVTAGAIAAYGESRGGPWARRVARAIGALVTEIVFAWPGLGGLMYDALLQRDYPVLLGLLAVVAALVVLFNALTDLLYGIVDPRIDWRGAR